MREIKSKKDFAETIHENKWWITQQRLNEVSLKKQHLTLSKMLSNFRQKKNKAWWSAIHWATDAYFVHFCYFLSLKDKNHNIPNDSLKYMEI